MAAGGRLWGQVADVARLETRDLPAAGLLLLSLALHRRWRLPGIASLLLVTGHGSIGLQLGPYSGKVVAGVIARGKAETDIGPFSLARFPRGS